MIFQISTKGVRTGHWQVRCFRPSDYSLYNKIRSINFRGKNIRLEPFLTHDDQRTIIRHENPTYTEAQVEAVFQTQLQERTKLRLQREKDALEIAHHREQLLQNAQKVEPAPVRSLKQVKQESKLRARKARVIKQIKTIIEK